MISAQVMKNVILKNIRCWLFSGKKLGAKRGGWLFCYEWKDVERSETDQVVFFFLVQSKFRPGFHPRHMKILHTLIKR